MYNTSPSRIGPDAKTSSSNMIKTVLVLGFICLMLIESVEMRCSWCICFWCRKGAIPKRQANSPCYMESFDTNGDGQISKSELLNVLSNAGPVSEHAKTVFVIMDKNADGMINSEEFYEAVPTLLKAGAIESC